MIRLITDGALPHPAKCCACGYGGNERGGYFWFKYKERWGQTLICTTCMTEAALLYDQIVPKSMYDEAVAENGRLAASNERLEFATDRFRLAFDRAIDSFRADLTVEAEEVPVEDEDDDSQRPETDFFDGIDSSVTKVGALEGI